MGAALPTFWSRRIDERHRLVYAVGSGRKLVRALESTYTRNGTLHLFAALQVATGQIHGKTSEAAKKTATGFPEFREELLVESPESEEYPVIMHKHSIRKRHGPWLDKHPTNRGLRAAARMCMQRLAGSMYLCRQRRVRRQGRGAGLSPARAGTVDFQDHLDDGFGPVNRTGRAVQFIGQVGDILSRGEHKRKRVRRGRMKGQIPAVQKILRGRGCRVARAVPVLFAAALQEHLDVYVVPVQFVAALRNGRGGRLLDHGENPVAVNGVIAFFKRRAAAVFQPGDSRVKGFGVAVFFLVPLLDEACNHAVSPD